MNLEIKKRLCRVNPHMISTQRELREGRKEEKTTTPSGIIKRKYISCTAIFVPPISQEKEEKPRC